MKTPTCIALLAVLIMTLLPLFGGVDNSEGAKGNPPLQGEMAKYECIYTGILEENAMGRYFGVDSIIKGMVTRNNYTLLDQLRDSKRIPIGQRVIVFASKDGKKLLILFVENEGSFKLKIEGREYRFRLEDLSESVAPKVESAP